MDIVYWKSEIANFGDELNSTYWSTVLGCDPKEPLIYSVPLLVLQTHHERNQWVALRPELVAGFNQRYPKSVAKGEAILGIGSILDYDTTSYSKVHVLGTGSGFGLYVICSG